jgi:light-regulated signal transduction histidine kinase (bacteriophytochrome)
LYQDVCICPAGFRDRLRFSRLGAIVWAIRIEVHFSSPDSAINAAVEVCMIVDNLEAKVQERTAELALKTTQLEERTHQLEAFSYSVSHDLRAPLRAISGFAHILSQRYAVSLDEKGQHFLENIIEASSHMSQLIDDMLSYSRLGRAAIAHKTTELRDIFDVIVRNVRDKVAEQNAALTIATDLPAVTGDRTLLSQIFTNLIDNALKYRRAKVPALVDVSWITDCDFVIVSVSDNGIGIEERSFEKIFDVFQRLHSQDEYPGTGIGLSVVRKACELQDGSVSVESTVGVGSTFHVRLKLAPKNSETQASPTQSEGPHASI